MDEWESASFFLLLLTLEIKLNSFLARKWHKARLEQAPMWLIPHSMEDRFRFSQMARRENGQICIGWGSLALL